MIFYIIYFHNQQKFKALSVFKEYKNSKYLKIINKQKENKCIKNSNK